MESPIDRLDDDVLLIILSYLERRDLCALSLTCKHFHVISSPRIWKILLIDRDFFVSRWHENIGTNAHYVREMVIRVNFDKPPTLADVLFATTNIRSLEVSYLSLLYNDPRLSMALAGLRELRELSCGCVEDKMLQMIQSIPSPNLTSLCLGYEEKSNVCEYLPSLISAIGSFPRLYALILAFLKPTTATDVTGYPPFTSIRQLTLTWVTEPVTDMIYLCPDVTSLDLGVDYPRQISMTWGTKLSDPTGTLWQEVAAGAPRLRALVLHVESFNADDADDEGYGLPWWDALVLELARLPLVCLHLKADPELFEWKEDVERPELPERDAERQRLRAFAAFPGRLAAAIPTLRVVGISDGWRQSKGMRSTRWWRVERGDDHGHGASRWLVELWREDGERALRLAQRRRFTHASSDFFDPDSIPFLETQQFPPADPIMPSLVEDVLLDVMMISDNKTISCLMRANKSLNYQGAKYLLNTDIVDLYRSRDLDSLIHFLDAHGGYRIPFLKGICLEMDPLQRSTAQRLDGLLTKHADKVSMKKLHARCLESLLTSHPFLSDTFSRLSTLEDLRFGLMGILGSKMLHNFQSKVKVANLEWMPTPKFDHTNHENMHAEEDARNAILVVKNFQSSLKRLKTNRAQLQRFDGNNNFKEVYPCVTDLELSNVVIDSISTVAVARAFPNLEHLDTGTNNNWISDRDELDDQHEMNVMEQTQKGSWRSLKSVTSGLDDLYILSPTCHIHGVHISGPKMHIRSLRRILKRTRPVHFALLQYEGNLFTPGLTEMLRKPCVEQVECFETVMRLGSALPSDLIDGPAMVNSWVTGISGLPRLRVLALALYCSLTPPGSLAAPVSSRAERFFRALDFDALAQRLFSAIPTLETLELAMRGLCGREPVFLRRGPENREFETGAAFTVHLMDRLSEFKG
ncbi:uncharacterized protein BXZ73DRAFT_104466 [Epithele typhae]|uniref:uncharacterized protein n=1 Tax=Epithele typhae TaxID=378194 RepID=UPI0020087E4D|nr:uncharacterized protein BXZ73DRAFT_104466 [Epithele typhae]KAH9921179.1 hypothetical protein BXZ73DRAFT_104466 [Epithele typhae]